MQEILRGRANFIMNLTRMPFTSVQLLHTTVVPCEKASAGDLCRTRRPGRWEISVGEPALCFAAANVLDLIKVYKVGKHTANPFSSGM